MGAEEFSLLNVFSSHPENVREFPERLNFPRGFLHISATAMVLVFSERDRNCISYWRKELNSTKIRTRNVAEREIRTLRIGTWIER